MFCVGSNYVWTWETNRVIREIVTSAGGRILAERLLELGETAVDHIVREIVNRKPPVVFNTLVGESSYRIHSRASRGDERAGVTIPMLSCSLCEPELRLIGSEASVGCVTSSAYFESMKRLKTAHLLRDGRRVTARGSSPSVEGSRPMSVSCCWRAPSAAPAQPMSAPSGVLPPTTVTIRRRARSGSTPTTTIAS